MEHPLRRPELFVCAWRGHSAPGTYIDQLDERHQAVARRTADGRRFVQCLRCGDWFVADDPPPEAARAVESIDDIERPRRGKALREALVLRMIAIDKAAHAIAFGAAAIAATAVRLKISAVHGWASSMLDAVHDAKHGTGGVNPKGFTAALLTRLSHVKPGSLTVLALFAGVYAVVSSVECVGLWMERRWAEYLTAIATAGFLPLEIHELLARVTFVRVLAITVNVVILAYLVIAKHLFGIGGPLPPHEAVPLEPLPQLADETTVGR
ncbi:MAG TPA: DUF2127 domain-containing protein [Acidimicrobiia bacterium]|nr:DUF2127 domain-containing protein [Acidimicrobiia bacterium]